MVIFGIDPSLNSCGYCAINCVSNSINLLCLGTIESKTGGEMYPKLNKIFDVIRTQYTQYKPDILAIEDVYVNSNPQTSLKLGIVRGVCMANFLDNKTEILSFESRLVKKTLTGNGNADKMQIQYMLKHILPSANPKTDDESDALAIAITAYLTKTTNKIGS
ncbi:crossover junction endodeoxyribonuclease RuvC [Candidatus Deianiraea vastatrix]|uniref:Crossover junction endodeoxyribonuclease RuvC n=1 Tax=Candidatus Deianiraea vastatrix TaxID=2163644 RepID=A0A5B8XIU8_9RICK|nr:crossover junction endodeoxyribonuclease RuvC [Candidatus Deianiraea vastatrix]QED23557.1 Crossover junction endodeoxyribonuclease RuvC [Candidatus Deianiraea vastatrix]